MVNVLALQFLRKILCLETMKSMWCLLCLQSSNDQFIQWPFPDQSPASFQWGSSSCPEFCDTVPYVYDEIVHWKRNLPCHNIYGPGINGPGGPFMIT